MKVVVGSLNPVKINAVKIAFSKYFDDVNVTGVKAGSNVRDTPLSDKETRQGAINRANNIFDFKNDFSVGLEGGLHETSDGNFLFGWAAILDKNKNIGLGSSGRFLIPNELVKQLKLGKDLGPLISEITGINELGKKQGAVGLATHNVITRTDFLMNATIFALVRFINKDYYNFK